MRVRLPEEASVIVGQAHFIKMAEDLAEAVATAVPRARYGVAFNEASGPCLVRAEGNDAEMKQVAVDNARAIGAGHLFVVVLRDCHALNVLRWIKDCPEVCNVFCATANPVEIVVAESEGGRGVMGVIDGAAPRGVETDADVADRRAFLRRIGYKR